VLLAIVAFYLLAPGYAPDLEIAGAGLSTLLIVGVYCMCMQSIYQSERCRRAEKPEPITGSAFRMPISWDLVQVAVAGSLVVAAGIWLPFVGERIALALSVDETFVGTILIAFTTSAPELVVAIAAIRIGAPNMAVGNLLGSNLFNLLILAPEDLLYRAGPLLQNISPQHVFSVISAMLMTVITMIAIARRSPDSKVRRIGLASGLLIGLYLINSFLIYSHQG
jgi:cation:H+ antiporter